MTNEQIMTTLLGRTNMGSVFPELIKQVENDYPIGNIRGMIPIQEGYEDANIKLVIDRGVYVLKIFSNGRSEGNIRSYVQVLTEAGRVKVPVTVLIKGKNGYLGEFIHEGVATRYIVTEFFEGHNFGRITPTLTEMSEVTGFLASLNTLQFPVVECYDSWGNKNLVQEFEAHQHDLSDEIIGQLMPIVDACRLIDTAKLSKGVIHGDMQRKHVLKQGDNYCILDFGCMRYDAKVYELSSYLAWFCLMPDTWDEREEILKKVLEKYQQVHQLSEYEQSIVRLLIRASYASFLLASFLQISGGDNSTETMEWHQLAKTMLERTKIWN